MSQNKIKKPIKWARAFAAVAGVSTFLLTTASGVLGTYFQQAADGNIAVRKSCDYTYDEDGRNISVSHINETYTGVPFFLHHSYASSTYDFATHKVINFAGTYSLDVFIPRSATIRNEKVSLPQSMSASEVVAQLGCPLSAVKVAIVP